ncbi:unnamed protein product [Nezara viridula]|uniref:RRM domain-containing protein n=1 Tax=Nezara viridula TaxID=85310 RepID=A0A9P0EIS6_NEZVI|nr:unnamed protein product [Nezara viridula]
MKLYLRYLGVMYRISMHKGYAFVQFTNPFDARGACLGEDGRTVLGQTLGRSCLLIQMATDTLSPVLLSIIEVCYCSSSELMAVPPR